MDDFIFRGRSIKDFGAVAAFGASMKTGAKIKRSEYELPGGGSVLIGEAAYQPTQRAVTITPADGVEATPRWRRALLGWLQSGRGEMIVLNDPDVLRLAQFDSDGTFGTQGWPLGELKLTLTLQPLAYNVLETSASQETSAGVARVPVTVDSAMRMPLRVILAATSGTITTATIAAGGEALELADLRLAAGQRLCYDAGQYLGDAASLSIDDEITFAPVANGRWARLTALPQDVARVQVTGGEARVTVIARGRWPA